jgi:phage terminase large subunit
LRDGGAIPDDRDLEMDLTGPLYKFDVNNAIFLEKKEDMKKRGVRSSDIADALALTFAYPVIGRALQRAEDDRTDEAYDPVWG